MSASERPVTVQLVLIGNELLSGKIADANGPFVATELRELGAELREICVIPDEPPLIAERVRSAAIRHDFVLTSGGVGPTHDDVTMRGVADAFGVPLVEFGELAARIRRAFASAPDVGEVWARMALLPQGCDLVDDGEQIWPVYLMRNVFVLPGIPEIFRRQFHLVKERFRSAPIEIRTIYFRVGEGELADLLAEAERRYQGLAVGSYPVLAPGDHATRVTLESRRPGVAEQAREWLCAQVGADSVVRTTSGVRSLE